MTSSSSPTARLAALDVLRAVAVLLVVGRHLRPAAIATAPWPVEPVLQVWARGGWCGVDLFFVLSGYLVAGVLLRELVGRGDARVGRFLARRAFKIQPPFWAFLGLTLALRWWQGLPPVPAGRLLVELLFLQNYLDGVWRHTWSLAVEEHFYLLLALVVLAAARRVRRGAPLDAALGPLVAAFVVVPVALPLLRAANAWARPRFDLLTHFAPTHLRLDSLLVGVAVAWLHHLRRAELEALVDRWRRALVAGGALLLAPPFVFELETTWWMPVLAPTSCALGSAALIAALVTRPPSLGPAGKAAAWIGERSYSIYLWHMAALVWLPVPLFRAGAAPWVAEVTAGVVGSALAGALATRVVERPALALRERVCP